jgi:hypothetical protein
LGTLVSHSDSEMAMTTACKFLKGAGLDDSRVVLRVSSLDHDLLALAYDSGQRVEVDGYEQRRFTHTFGNPGLTGRNINFAVDVRGELVDVGNEIIIERDGQPAGVEIAFGISNLIACRDELPHMLEATPAVIAREAGFTSRIEADALVSAVALALDGLRPVARGRGGRMRDFLRIVAGSTVSPETRSLLIRSLIDAEVTIRRQISPHRAGEADLEASDAYDLLAEGLERMLIDRADL